MRRWKSISGEFIPIITYIIGLHARTGSPKLVSRVLDVHKGHLCYIVGTVYMEMPLKPNVLEDIGRDVSSYLYLQ